MSDHKSAKGRTDFPLPDLAWDGARPYWDGAAREELCLPFCGRCGSANWYPKPTCPQCASDDFTWRPVSGEGTLFSYSVVRHAFLPAYADLVPMVPALVVLDDVPEVRIVTRIVDAEPADLRCDQRVVVTFRPLRFAGVDGEVVVPMFRPA